VVPARPVVKQIFLLFVEVATLRYKSAPKMNFLGNTCHKMGLCGLMWSHVAERNNKKAESWKQKWQLQISVQAFYLFAEPPKSPWFQEIHLAGPIR